MVDPVRHPGYMQGAGTDLHVFCQSRNGLNVVHGFRAWGWQRKKRVRMVLKSFNVCLANSESVHVFHMAA